MDNKKKFCIVCDPPHRKKRGDFGCFNLQKSTNSSNFNGTFIFTLTSPIRPYSKPIIVEITTINGFGSQQVCLPVGPWIASETVPPGWLPHSDVGFTIVKGSSNGTVEFINTFLS